MNVLNVHRVGEYQSWRLIGRNIDGCAGARGLEPISRDTAALERAHRVAADLVTGPVSQALITVPAAGPVAAMRLFAGRTGATRPQPGLSAAVGAGELQTGLLLTERSLVRVVRAVPQSVTVAAGGQAGAVTAGLLGRGAGGVELADAGVFVPLVLHPSQVTVRLPVTEPGLHDTFP